MKTVLYFPQKHASKSRKSRVAVEKKEREQKNSKKLENFN